MLGVRRSVLGAADAHGNAVESWAEPAPWCVRAVAPGASQEPFSQGRDLSAVLWTVYADDTPNIPGERDRVVFCGDEFEVEGRPADWSGGPFPNPHAGIVVRLKAVTG